MAPALPRAEFLYISERSAQSGWIIARFGQIAQTKTIRVAFVRPAVVQHGGGTGRAGRHHGCSPGLSAASGRQPGNSRCQRGQ